MWEETTIEQTPQNSNKEGGFSFSGMISKFSPFSPTLDKKDKKPSSSTSHTPKKTKLPGKIEQTTNRTDPVTPPHTKSASKVPASEYFKGGAPQDENAQNATPSKPESKEESRSSGTPETKEEGTELEPRKDTRTVKLEEFLKAPFITMDKFTKVTWNGITPKLRPIIWRILIGYTPANKERREETLERKRKEYAEFLDEYWFIKENERSEYEQSLYKQISIDVPRTNPTIKLFQQDAVQDSLNKILYIWAIRHPASGYVQGINDLATPFSVAFITSYCEKWEECQFGSLTEGQRLEIEADSFWCLSKLLDNVQDNYTVGQPGIHRMVQKMSELVKTIDAPLYEHLEKENAQFIQFTFRWMNCLLMRELPLNMIVRMWDTYLSEGDRFANFHIYVCVAFLIRFSEQLRQLDFQQIMLFIQNIPTGSWGDREMEVLLSTAYMYQSLYQNFKKK